MSPSAEPDPSLRRIQRDSAIVCACAALAALVIQRGRPGGALGVIAGGALMAYSHRAITGGVDAIVRKTVAAAPVDGTRPVSTRSVSWPILKFIARYLVIAVAAWAVLVPLRADPLGLFAGVTVPVVAIAIEAVRLLPRRKRP